VGRKSWLRPMSYVGPTVEVVTAQPIFDEPGPDDPAEILRALPAGYHAAFLAEYAEALETARRPEHYRELTTVLRLWRLRAVAYSDPTYADRLAAAKAGDTTGDVPLEDLVPGWPPA
jgi:hypothetical protein